MQNQFGYIIIDTPPTIGDLLVNALVAATHVLVPVETSYLGVSGLRELQKTIEQVQIHFRPELEILGYLPTLCEEQRAEAQEILTELGKRYTGPGVPAHPQVFRPGLCPFQPHGCVHLPPAAPAPPRRRLPPARAPRRNTPSWWIW